MNPTLGARVAAAMIFLGLRRPRCRDLKGFRRNSKRWSGHKIITDNFTGHA
jgi:hypothetical protein